MPTETESPAETRAEATGSEEVDPVPAEREEDIADQAAAPQQGVIAAARALFPGLEILGLDAVSPDEAVYAVADPRGGKVFTLHVFRAPRTLGESESVGSVAEKLSTLRAPGIAPLIHCEVRGGHPCFAFARPAGGESLAELLARDAVTPTMALRLMVQVSRGLDVAHGAGLNHHALHPGLIHVAPNGTATVNRTGFAGVFAVDQAAVATAFATAPAEVRAYLAPELLDPEGEPDHRADLFAIGAILRRCLTGDSPGGPADGTGLACGLDPRIDGVIGVCLDPDPERRCSDAALLAEALSNIGPSDDSADFALSPEKNPGQVSGAWVEESPPSRFPWRRIAVATVAAVAIAAAGAALWNYAPLRAAVAPGSENPFGQLGDPTALDGTLMSAEERMDTFSKIGTALKASGADIGGFERAVSLMQRVSDYPPAEAVIANHLAALDPSAPGVAQIEEAAVEFASDVAAYRAAMASASSALDAGDDRGEERALLDALGFLPEDARAEKALRANPSVVEERILGAITDMEHQAGALPLRVSYRVQRGASRLDLSSNPDITSVAALQGISVEELDLSGTAVADLGPLRDMPLRELWLDDTPVAELEPLRGMPLVTLSYERTAVHDATLAADLPGLKTLRYNKADGALVARVAPPTEGSPWENDLGMRFVPVDGIPGALVCRWETREIDWFRFQSETGGKEAGAPPEDLPGEPGSRFPARGISLAEAEAFCDWLSSRGWKAKFLGPEMRYRLPTDREWSLMAGFDEHPMLTPDARGLQGDPRLFRIPQVRLPVSHAYAGLGGITGLAGNVREWTSSRTNPSPDAPFAVRGFAAGVGPGAMAADAPPLDLRLRHPMGRGDSDDQTGFRVVLAFGDAAGEAVSDTGTELSNLVAAGEWASASTLATSWVTSPPSRHHQTSAEAFLSINSIREFYQAHSKLPSGFRKDVLYFRGHRYWLCPLPLDWGTAKSLAESAAGHLATLSSPEELAWFEEQFARPAESAPTVWIGAEPGGIDGSTQPPGWFWEGNPKNPLPSTAPAPTSGGHRLLIRPSDQGATWHQAPADENHVFLMEWG